MKTNLVVCESADGWSLHAPDATDEAIASGDAPPILTGAWESEEHEIPESAVRQAEAMWAEREGGAA